MTQYVSKDVIYLGDRGSQSWGMADSRLRLGQWANKIDHQRLQQLARRQ
jgi:hypothetical protein